MEKKKTKGKYEREKTDKRKVETESHKSDTKPQNTKRRQGKKKKKKDTYWAGKDGLARGVNMIETLMVRRAHDNQTKRR